MSSPSVQKEEKESPVQEQESGEKKNWVKFEDEAPAKLPPTPQEIQDKAPSPSSSPSPTPAASAPAVLSQVRIKDASNIIALV